MGLFKVLKDLANQVQKRNKENPKVETADNSVFDSIRDAIDDIKSKKGETPAPEREEECVDELQERVFEVQRKNEANPDVATADTSIFDELNDLLKNQKSKASVPTESEVFDQNEVEYEEIEVEAQPAPSFEDTRVVAITNSMGGSLAFRAEPDLGAPVNEMRIPDSSRVYVVQYSEHSINLDGKTSRWALIDYEGQRGWVLEGYLNFN